MVKTGPTNKHTVRLIATMEKTGRKQKAAIWVRAAQLLSRPTRQRVEVNLSKLVPYSGTVLVPGKVLSTGNGTKATVAAFAFSQAARDKIVKAGGKAVSIEELIESNPTGKNVKLVI